MAAVATTTKLLATTLLAGALAASAFAFEIRPNPNLTGGSVRIDGHDISTTCGPAKPHRSSLPHALRDKILTRYGLPPGTHPDFEIDHLIPWCLGGSDDFVQSMGATSPQYRAGVECRGERPIRALGLRNGLQ